MDRHDLLLEIGLEELPSMVVQPLAEALSQQLTKQLAGAGLAFGDVQTFATPRRLAVLIESVQLAIAPEILKRRGPAVAAAFDEAGKPTKACLGFLKSAGASLEDCEEEQTDKGSYLVCQVQKPGKATIDLLPSLVQASFKQLPIPRQMRWGEGTEEFVRPVHWLLLLLGEQVVPATLFSCDSDRMTHGHRFHHPQAISIAHPSDYVAALFEAKVIVDFSQRRALIATAAEAASALQGTTLIDPELLTEVTGIVEWPVALLGNFSDDFLAVPQEALISALQDHQKCFPVVDAQGKLLPHFVLISNIESRAPAQVIIGNERVVRARLADAAFFFEFDKKKPLAARVNGLADVVFQEKLGTLADKTERLIVLAMHIAGELGIDEAPARQAASLAKLDLLTELVGEFPELQGIAGYYYARQDGEPESVALAIREHYQPRGSEGALPETVLGQVLALADRLDDLVSFFSVGLVPTGEKDPFGMRRAALGFIKVASALTKPLHLRNVISYAVAQAAAIRQVDVAKLEQQLVAFMQDRYRVWAQAQGFSIDVINAVMAVSFDDCQDLMVRLKAVTDFRGMDAAAALIAANKRVSNILRKQSLLAIDFDRKAYPVQPSLLQLPAEQTLYRLIESLFETFPPLLNKQAYAAVLASLAELKAPIDDFFEAVMVMAKEEKLRTNRLNLLIQLRQVFLCIADFSLLQ